MGWADTPRSSRPCNQSRYVQSDCRSTSRRTRSKVHPSRSNRGALPPPRPRPNVVVGRLQDSVRDDRRHLRPRPGKPLPKTGLRSRRASAEWSMPRSAPPPLPLAAPHETYRRKVRSTKPGTTHVRRRNEGADAEISTHSHLRRNDKGSTYGTL